MCIESSKVPSSGPSIAVQNVTAAWDSNNERDVLKNVSFEVDSVSYVHALVLVLYSNTV